MWVRSLCGFDPLQKGIAAHSSILPGESHGPRSLVGYSPWGDKESAQQSAHTHTHTHTHTSPTVSYEAPQGAGPMP